jgi:hypothetical protein
MKPKNWSDSGHYFLKQCVDAGNVEASYTLGMVSQWYYSKIKFIFYF